MENAIPPASDWAAWREGVWMSYSKCVHFLHWSLHEAQCAFIAHRNYFCKTQVVEKHDMKSMICHLTKAVGMNCFARPL